MTLSVVNVKASMDEFKFFLFCKGMFNFVNKIFGSLYRGDTVWLLFKSYFNCCYSKKRDDIMSVIRLFSRS